MRHHGRQFNFTLAELLVYGVLLSILLAASISVFQQSVEFWEAQQHAVFSQQNARRISSDMTRMIQNANGLYLQGTAQGRDRVPAIEGSAANLIIPVKSITDHNGKETVSLLEYRGEPADSTGLTCTQRSLQGQILKKRTYRFIDDVTFHYASVKQTGDLLWTRTWKPETGHMPAAIRITFQFDQPERKRAPETMSTVVHIPPGYGTRGAIQ